MIGKKRWGNPHCTYTVQGGSTGWRVGEWRVGETTTNPTVEGIGGVNGGSARGVDVWCARVVWYGYI